VFKKILGLIFLVSGYWLLVTFVYAQETLTITTYYPSPYGSYQEIRANRIAIGDNYSQYSQYCWPGGTCTNTIDANADLVVEGNVGIGTANPQAMQNNRDLDLDVTHNIITDDIYLRNPSVGNPRWASEVNINNCQICIHCQTDGGTNYGACGGGVERCVNVNEGWSGWSGDNCSNGSPEDDNARCRIRMVCP